MFMYTVGPIILGGFLMVAAIRQIERTEREPTDVLAGVRSIGELLPAVLARYRLPLPKREDERGRNVPAHAERS